MANIWGKNTLGPGSSQGWYFKRSAKAGFLPYISIYPLGLDGYNVWEPDKWNLTTGGYPYFIQFICREVYDSFLQLRRQEATVPYSVPMDAITMKLDSDFFAGRWARATDRQRELLWSIATLGKPDEEFTVQEVVQASKQLEKPFTSSHVNQILASLCGAGLVYKNRFGKYSFAVPLFDRFILRQIEPTVLS